MSVPANNPINSALDGGGWSPERELLEAAPRRYASSPWPDYNQPNAPVYVGAGALVAVVGLIIFFVAVCNGLPKFGLAKFKAPCIIGGGLMALVGAGIVSTFPVRRTQHLNRAANLIENGAPVMARIVNVQNLTGDSEFGRLVTYMVTMPGANEETRREIKADDRALPKRIPGPATALIDFKSNEIELYCVLPYVAVSKFAATSPRSQQTSSDLTTQAGIPTMASTPTPRPMPTATPAQMPTMPVATSSPTPSGGMATLGNMGEPVAAEPKPEPEPVPANDKPEKPAEPRRPAPTGGAAKLPWEQ